MRILALAFTSLLYTVEASALSCAYRELPKGVAVEVTRNESHFAFSAPDELDKFRIESVMLHIHSKKEGVNGALQIPVSFSVFDGVAKGHFSGFGGMFNVRLSVNYGHEVCGPKLGANIDI